MGKIELQPPHLYVSPEYWDGNRLGIDAVPCGEFLPLDHAKMARDALKRKLSLMYGGYKPLKRLAQQEVFDANDHPPGTIIRLRREMATSHSSDYRVYDDPGQEPVLPSSLTAISKSIYFPPWGGTHPDKTWYTNHECWGVVTPGEGGRQGLLGVPALELWPSVAGEEPRIFGTFRRIMPPQFKVGEVYGAPRIAFAPHKDRTHHMRYRRVLSADIVGWAGKKKPSKIKQAAAKLGELLLPGQAPEPIPIRADRSLV